MTQDPIERLKELYRAASPHPWAHDGDCLVDAEGDCIANAVDPTIDLESNSKLIETAINALPVLLEIAESYFRMLGKECPSCGSTMDRIHNPHCIVGQHISRLRAAVFGGEG